MDRSALSQNLEGLLAGLAPSWFGSVVSVDGSRIVVAGLSSVGRLGDRLVIEPADGERLSAETIGVNGRHLVAYAFGPAKGVACGDRVLIDRGATTISPSDDWLGSVLDWRGKRIDGTSPRSGADEFPLDAAPPAAPLRKRIGERIATGHAVFDTFLPLCRGQRVGLFAGSGIGKSMLLGSLARHVEADVCVLALIGERGREVRAFVEDTLGPQGLERAVVIASTSDESALAKRQSARLAMATAEYFRARGKHVLLIFDSLTRYADAHREFALAAGEPPSLHAYPPSTFHAIASLVERAGPGAPGEGDITAIFSVLVAGSDMDEPVADIVRGVLDGHIVLDRAIAERGRFPAVNVRRSVSRSLPFAASDEENTLLRQGRSLLAAYEEAEMIVRAGLYAAGSDPQLDQAIRTWPALDRFFTVIGDGGPQEGFAALKNIFNEKP
ncbi:MAG: FliI/YscN family ATPase [Pseudomonadota bacterium]